MGFTNFEDMRTLFFFFFFSCGLGCLALDQDYNDYRRKTESFSHIYDKSLRSDLACFTIGGIEESLGKTPLAKLPVSSYGSNYISFDTSRIQVTIRAAPFVVGKHKMQYEGKHLVRIDNRPYYGNYGKVPALAITGLLVILDHDTVAIPTSAYQDLYNPSFTYKDASGGLMSQDAVFLSADKRTIYIYMLNKDNSGSYEVTWIIQDKKYLRRILDWGFTN
jgi:hypothetical protein